MPRLVLSSSIIQEKEFRISGQDAHYLLNVLRLRPGDEVQILDEKGHIYRTEITSITKKEVSLRILSAEEIITESPLNLVLVQGILKGEKMDLVIQKATELGVKEIFPVITSRTIVRKTGKTGRWQKIILEAVRQSGRTAIPLLHEPLLFEEFLDSAKNPLRGFIFYEGERVGLKAHPLISSEGREPLYCVIGPEGGFTFEEIRSAISKGLIPAGLGPRILRAETASLTALSILQFLAGDLG